MFKLIKLVALGYVLLVSLVGCEQDSAPDSAHKQVLVKDAEALKQSSDLLSEQEIRMGGTPRKIATDRVGFYQYGRTPTEAELSAWDIDVRADGLGLPPGSGSVTEGEILYQDKCATCHGVFGEGEGRWPQLAGGFGTLAEDKPEKTVGSYWPYVSTLWDYIHRAMPFFEPQSLADDEVYAITAYVLYLNDLVDEDFVADQTTLSDFEMPNKDGFFIDPRPDSTNTTCMKGCRDPDSIRITWDASTLGVTPVEHLEKNKHAMNGVQSSTKANESKQKSGEVVYKQACALCHGSGMAGAPALTDSVNWQKRLENGVNSLVNNAINGFQGETGYMPAKGGQVQLTDQEVNNAVLHMLSEAGISVSGLSD